MSPLKGISDEWDKEIQEEIETWWLKCKISPQYQAYIKILKGKLELAIINDDNTITITKEERRVLNYVLEDFLPFTACLKEALETVRDQNELIQKLKGNEP